MKCTLCNFSCLYSSQMIQHTLKSHTSKLSKNSQTISPEKKSLSFKRKVEMDPPITIKKTKLEISLAVSTNTIKSKLTINPTNKSNSKTTDVDATMVPDVYACKECEYHNPMKKNYERHMWCHTSNFPFKCTHCSFSSIAENAVKRHITQYHTAIKQNTVEDHLNNSSSSILNLHKQISKKSPNFLDTNGYTSTSTKATASNIKKEITGDLLKCIIIKTRTKENLTSWTCHSCEITSQSSAAMNEHTTMVHQSSLQECVTIIQDYYIINGNDPKEVQEGLKEVACAHCGLEIANMGMMQAHLRDDCHVLKEDKGDESGEEGEQRSLSLVLEKSESDAKRKGPLGKFSKALNDMMERFNSFYGTSSSKKLYLVCFICKYKTYSMKVLKKHLIRQHAEIITNGKELNSLSRKCLFYSLKHECKLIEKTIFLKNKQKKDVVRFSAADEDDSEEEEEKEEKKGKDSLLKMEVTAIPTENDAKFNQVTNFKDFKSPEMYKHEILDSFKQEGEINKVFECSVCSKKVFFKCNLKKHVESTHPKAKIIHLSLVDGTLSQDDLIKFHKKHRVNKLKKLLSKRGVSKNKLIALNALISDELEGQSLEYVLDRSESNGEEKVGMIDNLRLKRFQCGVCSFRSNFRSDISRHLKVKHPNRTNSFYTVLSIEEATNSLEMYNLARPTIDMRYTKQKHTTFSLLPSKSASSAEPSSSTDTNYNTIITEASIVSSINSIPASSSLLIGAPTSNNGMHAFYQSLPYSLRRSNQLEDLLKCHICPFYTFKATSFKVHLSCHHTLNRTNQLSCPHCLFFVSTKRLYEKHLDLHSQYALFQATRISNYALKSGNQNTSSFTINTYYGDASYNFNPNYISEYRLYCHQNYKNAHLRFCHYKYICPQCPFKTNRREDFWCHGKFHFEGKGRFAEFKCEQCCFYATDKRGLIQHSTLHNKGYTPKAILSQSDLVKGEFCRCDLADFLKHPDLACFKQLSCNYCSYSNNSVRLLRQHIASHVSLTSCYTTRIFSADLDNADDLLNILCTRLLNMNYFLAEQAYKKEIEAEGTDDAFNAEMPVLEKFTDLPSPEIYNPHQSTSVSFEQLPIKPPIKVINLYNNSFKNLNSSDSKPPKIIKITSHISTTNLPFPTPYLPKLTLPTAPPLLLPDLLKVSNASRKIKEELKIEIDLSKSDLTANKTEGIESIVLAKILSAPEVVISEEKEEFEKCENDNRINENIKDKDKKKADEANVEEIRTGNVDDVVWKSECQCAKRIFMLSLGLVEMVNV